MSFQPACKNASSPSRIGDVPSPLRDPFSA